MPITSHLWPVVGLDIDGTLGDYHYHFHRFAKAYVGRQLGPVHDGMLTIGEEYDGSVPFHKWLGIGKATYREAKLAYRRGGQKRSMPAFPYASELTRNLRKARIGVWLCTTRPYLSHDNIDRDTAHWCRRNGIQFDELLWSPHKWRILRKEMGERVAAALEDLPNLCSQATTAGIPSVLMLDRTYNRGQAPEGVAVAKDLRHAEELILAAVAEWRSNGQGQRQGRERER